MLNNLTNNKNTSDEVFFVNLLKFYFNIMKNFFSIYICFLIIFSLSVKTNAQIPLQRLQAWYIGDSVVAASNVVSQWIDISGNNRHLNQITESRKPLLIENAFGGYPVIQFDGVNDYFQAIFVDTLYQPITIFVVWRIHTQIAQEIFDGLTEQTSLVFNYPYNAFIWLRMYAGATGGYSIMYDKAPSPLFTISSLFFTNPARLYDNGVLVGTQNIGNNFLTGLNVGTRYLLDARYFTGDMAEFILYDTLLTEPQRIQVETYLMDKYAPPVSLGADTVFDYSLCPYTLGVSPDYTSVLWSTGSTDDTITVSQSGSYWVQVVDVFGRLSSDTISVQFPYFAFADTTICFGDTVAYTCQLQCVDYDYLWSDASTGYSLQVSQPGTYWLQVTDSTGCSLTDTFVVAVDSFAVQASLGPDLSVCSGESIGLVTGAAQAVDYVWSTFEFTPTIVLQTPGEYSVTATNTRGCVAIDTINVAFQGYKPDVGFVADSVCFGFPTSFTDNSTATAPDAIAYWEWTIEGNTITQQHPQYEFSQSGNHSVELYVETDSGCVATIINNVFVLPNPQAAFLPYMGCSGQPVQFTNLTTLGYGIIQAYEWWAVDSNNVMVDYSTNTHPLLTFPGAGLYDVYLVAVSEIGCRDTAVHVVEIKTTPPVDFSWTNICKGQTTAFTETTQVPAHETIIIRNWSFGDGGVSNLPNPLHLYQNAGTYDVTLYNKSVNGCDNTITKPVTIYHIPVAGFDYSLPCLNTPVQFFDTSSVVGGTIDHLLWTFPEEDTTSVWQPMYLFPDTGSYSVSLMVTSDQGCKNSATQTVNVYPYPHAAFSFSPEYGIPPLDVTFVNESEGAVSYYWNFGDDVFSVLPNPVHTYTQTNVYTVNLTATNIYSCNDTAWGTVYVIPSTYDIAVSAVDQVVDGNLVQSMIQVKNLGTRTVRSLLMKMQVDQGIPFVERWEGELASGQTIWFTFGTMLEDDLLETKKSICYSALPDEDVEDVNLNNNTWCTIIDPGFYIMSVSPNPANDEIFVSFVLKETGAFRLEMVSSDGKRVIEQSDLQGSQGMNMLRIDLSNLRQGVYLFRISNDVESDIERILIAR